MAFTPSSTTHLRQDAQGVLRHIRHVQEPFAAAGVARAPQAISQHYIREVAHLYNFPQSMLQNLHESPSEKIIAGEDSRLRLTKEKRAINTRTLSYAQTYLGIPVWRRGVTVIMEDAEQRVTSSTNTVDYDVRVADANQKGNYQPDKRKVLAGLLDEIAAKAKAKVLSINGAKLYVYRYDPKQRQASAEPIGAPIHDDVQASPSLPLEPVPNTVKPGQYYVVTELLFTLTIGPWKNMHWRALINIRSGAVLYERAAISGVDASIFPLDPPSQTDDTTITACSGTGTLNPLRQTVTLQGLTVADPQPLSGEYVTLGEQADPAIAPPTEPVGNNFQYDADADNFAAANAYYHCDAAFRLIEQLGFDLGTYFGGTTFPVTVDHRDASLGVVNAVGYGNTTNDGSGYSPELHAASVTASTCVDFRVCM